MTTQSVTPGQLDLDAGPPPSAAPASGPENAFLAGNPAALGIPVFVAGSGRPGARSHRVCSGRRRRRAAGHHRRRHRAWPDHRDGLGGCGRPKRRRQRIRHLRGFWISYALLVFGLLHDLFGITLNAIVHTQGLFLITWIVIMGMLTLATLRLPLAFTAIFALVELALIAVLIGTINASECLAQDRRRACLPVCCDRRLRLLQHRLGRHRRARSAAREAGYQELTGGVPAPPLGGQ